jgi:cytochrome c-type biogenesis protein CcmH
VTASRRWGPWVVLAVVVVAVLVIGTRPSGGPRTEAQRVQHIGSQLRCPVCEGQSVAESNAPVSQAIRDDIRQRVRDGQSDGQILAFVVSRYPNTLLTPPSSGVGVIVWALPVLAFVAAAGFLGLAFARWRARPGLAVSDADRALVEAARRQ